MLDVPECQVNSRQGHIRFFRYLMLEVLLRVARHDEQAPVGQPFRKCNRAILLFETK